ncbi:uncharacterized protein LOC144129908 [Amblyomma americanum]
MIEDEEEEAVMTSTTEPSSTCDSWIGTSAETCASCAADGEDLEFQRPSIRQDRSLFATAETGVAARYTLCCALGTTVISVVLLGIAGVVWYRYVIRPNMLLEPTSAPRSQEEQPKVLVVVVQATEGVSAVATKPAFVGRGNASRANTDTVTALASDGAGVAAGAQAPPTEEPLPAPL